MMRNFALVLVALSLAGCASLRDDAFTRVSAGDPSSKVLELFGKPERFEEARGGTRWYYSKRKDACVFTIVNDAVAGVACGANENYVAPVGAILGGAGRGLGASSRSSKQCVSRVVGSTVFTDCD